MKNTLTDLHNALFESIERLQDDELDAEALEREIKRAEAVNGVAKAIIENANLAFKAVKHADEYGYGQRKAMPPMLETRDE